MFLRARKSRKLLRAVFFHTVYASFLSLISTNVFFISGIRSIISATDKSALESIEILRKNANKVKKRKNANNIKSFLSERLLCPNLNFKNAAYIKKIVSHVGRRIMAENSKPSLNVNKRLNITLIIAPIAVPIVTIKVFL